MLSKLIKILLIILFITLPLINSHLLDFFGLEKFGKYFYVNGNYEFTKVIFFNIFSSVILFLYFLGIIISPLPQGRGVGGGKIIFPILIALIVSTFFSISPYTSLFGNSDKGHSLVMFFNLIGIYIILINSKYNFKKPILFYSILGLIPVIYLALGEFFKPHYDYGNLSNRALGTFGHPNYLALYLLLFIPIVQNYNFTKFKFIKYFLLIGITTTLILTKSILAIFLLIIYLIYNFFFISKYKNIKKIYFIIFLIFILLSIIQNFGFTKLDSFLSRFYIWETTKNIIFSDYKIFFIGNGLGNLSYIFDNFKVPETYIFENFGFTADRPHNIFLNIFYNFGIFGLIIFLYLLTKFFILFKENKNKYYKISLLLALFFLIFNYASISSYLIIILIISLIYNYSENKKNNILNYFLLFLIIFTSIIGGFFSIKYFIEEHKKYSNLDYSSKNFIIKKIEKENFEKEIFKKNFTNYKVLCQKLLEKNKTAENYIYCGNLLYYTNKKQAIIYYKLGLKKLPDLWNKNSKYFKNPFIKNNPNILHRFYSTKFNNLGEILKRVGIKN